MTDRRFLWLSILAFTVAAVLATVTNAEISRPQARPVAYIATQQTAPEAPPIRPVEQIAAAAQSAAQRPEPEAVIQPVVLEAPTVGPETNLPLPRYVSLKSDEGNVRRGPSLTHRIDWVFVRRGMPLQVTGEYGHWRRVIDREGIGGWVHYALLSGSRTVIVDEAILDVLARPLIDAQVVAQFEAGVVARLGECTTDWCRITAGGYRGWVPKTALWGVEPDELRD